MRIETCSKYFVFCSLICLNSLCKGSYTQVYSSLGENSLFCMRLNPQRVEDDSTHFALESKEYICVPVLLKKNIWHILYQHLLVQQINMLLWMCNGCEEIERILMY